MDGGDAAGAPADGAEGAEGDGDGGGGSVWDRATRLESSMLTPPARIAVASASGRLIDASIIFAARGGPSKWPRSVS